MAAKQSTRAFARIPKSESPPDALLLTSRLFQARAVLGALIDSLDCDRADGRYVLWTVRDMISEVATKVELLGRSEVPHG